jgi:hypothetical protein
VRAIALVAAHVLSATLTAAHAQVIAVKTAPVSDGGQFAFLPSANLSLGGLSIALADSAHDPFVNPAKGSRLTGVSMFASPTFFSVTRKAGGGITLPIGMNVSGQKWFGQFAIAMQEVDQIGDDQQFLTPSPLSSTGVLVTDDEVSRQNRYVHGLAGRRFSNTLSIAASASWWRLNAMDGVELYYPGSQGVRQHGEAADLRLGMLKTFSGGQSIEVIALHNRFGVNQDVSFAEFFWDPSLRQMTLIPRFEPNADRTGTWGLHLGYTRPLADSSWRVGAIMTGNRITQSSLPDYGLPVVPGDAGRAHAFNLGGGIARMSGPWTVGFDAVFEPIWNRTWVRADEPVETLQGATLDAGTRTLENDFRFTNAIARLGVGAKTPISKDFSLTFEAGGRLHAMRYRLEQDDALRGSRTASTQRWNEWTRSWGLSFRAVNADLRYRGQMTTGARRPGFDDFGGGIVAEAPRPGATSIVPGPFGPVGLPFAKVRATTHQISLSVPIR